MTQKVFYYHKNDYKLVTWHPWEKINTYTKKSSKLWETTVKQWRINVPTIIDHRDTIIAAKPAVSPHLRSLLRPRSSPLRSVHTSIARWGCKYCFPYPISKSTTQNLLVSVFSSNAASRITRFAAMNPTVKHTEFSKSIWVELVCSFLESSVDAGYGWGMAGGGGRERKWDCGVFIFFCF